MEINWLFLVTKNPGWFSQYSDYNIGWTALILISCEGQDKFLTLFFKTTNPVPGSTQSRV